LFENSEIAKYVLQVFLNVNGQMNDSIRTVESQTSREEFKWLRALRGTRDERSV
jgi:hypothetical protein